MTETTIPTTGLETILHEIVTESPHHLSNPKCGCHIIDPKVHRLILWMNINKETGAIEYTLRIGSQRFTSLTITDKNGQTYWRFQSAGEYVDGKQTINNNKQTN